jgi:hypothetical protein
MRFSQSVFSAFMASVAADPPPKEISLQSPEELKLKDGTIMTVTSGSKRSPEEIKLADGTTMTVSDDAHEKRAPTNVKRSVARRCPTAGLDPTSDRLASCLRTHLYIFIATIFIAIHFLPTASKSS